LEAEMAAIDLDTLLKLIGNLNDSDFEVE